MKLSGLALAVLAVTAIATDRARTDDWLLDRIPEVVSKDYFLRPVKECDVCPQMVILPPGEFDMGSPSTEKGRREDEGPVHKVRFAKPFALGRYEVTVAQFRAFIRDTGYVTSAEKNIGTLGCYGWSGINRLKRETTSGAAAWIEGNFWDHTGVPQQENDPVRCVSLPDAQAYVTWLNKVAPSSGYRLPSEAEWEYGARAGSQTSWFWGNEKSAACRFANINDLNWRRRTIECSDGFPYVANVGSLAPNPYSLYDTAGNVAEWVADCYHENYEGAPVDGSAWVASCKHLGIFRDGYYAMAGDPIVGVRPAVRSAYPAVARSDGVGFRIAKTLP